MRTLYKFSIPLIFLLIVSNIYALTLDQNVVNTAISNSGSENDFAENKYQLIQGYATTNEACSNSTSKKMGYYHVIIGNSNTCSGNTNEIAINKKTREIAILTGKLIIKLKALNEQTITALESRHNLTISNKFPHLGIVFANTATNIISASKEIAKEGNVDSVRIELIDHILTPN